MYVGLSMKWYLDFTVSGKVKLTDVFETAFSRQDIL